MSSSVGTTVTVSFDSITWGDLKCLEKESSWFCWFLEPLLISLRLGDVSSQYCIASCRCVILLCDVYIYLLNNELKVNKMWIYTTFRYMLPRAKLWRIWKIWEVWVLFPKLTLSFWNGSFNRSMFQLVRIIILFSVHMQSLLNSMNHTQSVKFNFLYVVKWSDRSVMGSNQYQASLTLGNKDSVTQINLKQLT